MYDQTENNQLHSYILHICNIRHYVSEVDDFSFERISHNFREFFFTGNYLG